MAAGGMAAGALDPWTRGAGDLLAALAVSADQLSSVYFKLHSVVFLPVT